MTGAELRNRRHQLNLTQSTMAERLGLSKRTIRRYELLEEIPKWLQIIMGHHEDMDAWEKKRQEMEGLIDEVDKASVVYDAEFGN